MTFCSCTKGKNVKNAKNTVSHNLRSDIDPENEPNQEHVDEQVNLARSLAVLAPVDQKIEPGVPVHMAGRIPGNLSGFPFFTNVVICQLTLST